jgi:outer membrane protein assembly factor BamB
MKKTFPAILILIFTLSCVLVSTPELGETNFPLQQVAKVPVEAGVKDIALGYTWIAISTSDDKVMAVDIDTQEILWEIDFSTLSGLRKGVFMENDDLIAVSPDQIIVLDKSGNRKDIEVDKDVKTITEVFEVNSGYIYIVGGPNWDLQAYDYQKNIMLWEKRGLGRGVRDVSYDPENKLVYVTLDEKVYTDDNLTGKTLSEAVRHYGEHLIDGVLYTLTNTSERNEETHYEINAVDVKTQKTLWQNSFDLGLNDHVGPLLAVGDLLVFSGDGMIAFNKFSGEQAWEIDVHAFGESIDAPPVEFDDVIYAMGYASNTVFAVSPDEGTIIGTANLEKDDSFGVLYGEVFRLEDGILFNTSDSIVIYKIK